MNPPALLSSRLTEPWWKGIILALSGAVLVFSAWCLANGITIIFMHLYYFPIVLLSYRYRWKGCGLAILLGLAYLGLVIVFEAGRADVILGAFYRFLVFAGVAAVIAYLSEQLVQARKARQQSAGLRERYLSLAPAIILALDRDGIITFLNEKGGRILECVPDEVVGRSWADMFLPEKDRARIRQVFLPVTAGQADPIRVFESPALTCSGREKTIRWYNTVLHDENGAVTGTLGFGEDITEEKWSQKALQEMQQFQEGVIANANVWISVLDTEGVLLVWNDAAESISGYKKQDVLGKNTVWRQLYPDTAYRRKVTGEIRRVIGRDEFLENFETGIQCADGTKKTIVWNTRGLRDNRGATTRYIAIGRDVTAQKAAEFRAAESSRFLATMIDTLPMPVFFKDTTGKYLGCNPPFEEYIGVKRDQLIGKTAYDVSPKDLADRYTSADRLVFDSPVAQRYETQVRYADGSRRDVIFYKAPFFNKDGSVGGLIGAFLDITDRKKTEEALRDSEEKFRTIFESSNDAILLMEFLETGRIGRIIDVNEMVLKQTGYTREELLAGTTAMVDSPDMTGKLPSILTELPVKNHATFESEVVRKDGTLLPIETSIRLIRLRGQPCIISIARDITDRKRAEAMLLKSRQLFSDIIRFLPDPTFVIDKDGRVLAWNHALEELSGVPAADVIGKGEYEYSLWLYGKRRSILIDLVLHPDQDAGRMNYTDIHREGTTITAQAEIILPGRERIPVSLVASPLIDAQGNITGAIESLRDISRIRETEAELARMNRDLESIVRDRTRLLEDEVAQRIRAEQDVQAALRYTRSVIESNPDLVAVLDENGMILDINAAGEVLTGIPREKLISTQYTGYLIDDGTLQDKLSGLLREGRIASFVQLRRNDGHITPLSVNATVIRGMDGGKDRIIVAAHDITRQKQDEQAIQASLDEKVLLLREIHHRVKNNLQIIISLTNLQMRQAEDPGVKEIMAETQNRVRAMSLVHEKLYRSENLARIDFADYTRFLATQLFSYYGTDTQRVRLDLAMEPIMVDINAAVPLGLIMNELVSNALKHAFPGGKEGTIHISGSDTGDRITLVIRDNGIGIPAGLDWRNTASLGMRLVTSLVDQVDGTITLDRNGGTAFTVTVPGKPAS